MTKLARFSWHPDHIGFLTSGYKIFYFNFVTIFLRLFSHVFIISYIMEIKEIEKHEKNMAKYYCEYCDFKCFNKGDWNRHIIRPKHLSNKAGNGWKHKKLEKTFTCEECDKIFKTNAGLWKHKKRGNCSLSDDQSGSQSICFHNDNYQTNNAVNNGISNEIIMMILKQNTDLIKEQSDIKQMILEIVKGGALGCHNNTINNNSHNKSFNLQFFLNETCKNAMNISEFIDSIKLQLSDLIDVGEKGYVDGISNIIIKNLNALDETIRPIHCTDQKREVVYIKENNEWTKDDDTRQLKRSITKVADKNMNLLPLYREKNPEYDNPCSHISDNYGKIVLEAMGGSIIDKDRSGYATKIVRNICRVTSIKRICD